MKKIALSLLVLIALVRCNGTANGTATKSAGQIIFETQYSTSAGNKSCADCHGSSGGGGSGGSSIKGKSSQVSSAVRNGISSMPSYSTSLISDANLSVLITYVSGL